MKETLHDLVHQALTTLQREGVLAADIQINFTIENSRDKQHGDFATNAAMVLAKQAKMPPRDLAQALIDKLATHAQVQKVEIAGPGFINFFLSSEVSTSNIAAILEQKESYGHGQSGKGRRVIVEFVSANPTGPLHVGHGRGAAYGSALSNLLETQGFAVHREYYVNDAGRQMDILALSVWLRYLQLFDSSLAFPANAYQGDYIIAMAEQIQADHGQAWQRDTVALYDELDREELVTGSDAQDAHIDLLIQRCKAQLDDVYPQLHGFACATILEDIREDLAEFAVEFQQWFSEKQLYTSGAVDKALALLREAGHIYEKEGAIWFKATEFGDDKDRVLVRENGQPTYFASDVAYHVDKFARGFDWVIDVMGADHHGYVGRVRAALVASGCPVDDFTARLVQFATLYRGEERVQMSTRSGSFVTLRELRDEVGTDAARFFYVARKSEQHMDFDLELAKSQSNDNPVYYVQYAHARICSIFKQLEQLEKNWQVQQGLASLSGLAEEQAQQVADRLLRYPELLKTASLQLEPHLLVHYLRDLAQDFHSYYNAHQILVDDDAVRNARLCLVAAIRQVLANGLRLLGVTAPQTM